MALEMVNCEPRIRMMGVWLFVDEASFEGVADESGDIADVEAFHDVGAMGFDGFDADVELLGDFFGGTAVADQLEDFFLSSCQGRFLARSIVLADVIGQMMGDSRTDVSLPLHDGFDSVL